jgi:molybdate transport system substrate-binding protein
MCLAVVACGGAGGGTTAAGADAALVVFAAASASRVLPDEITALGRTHRNLPVVRADYEGTQSLLAKLEADAGSADVFISADKEHMDEASRRGLVRTPQVLAENRLVIAVAPGNPEHITGLADLARPGLRISLADTSVPASKYAEQALRLAESRGDVPAGTVARVLANVATRQPQVETVVSDVAFGAVDAGIVYASDAHTRPGDTQRIEAVPIPPADQPRTAYYVAVTAHARNPAAAAAFVQLLLSRQGQDVLRADGFIPLPTPTADATP